MIFTSRIHTRPVLPVLSNVKVFLPSNCISFTFTVRRELEKLKKDLEEEKQLRSNLEVMLAIWGVGWEKRFRSR